MADKGYIFRVLKNASFAKMKTAIKAVHDSGYRVPEDVAVFGFDNTINSEFNYGGISSVDIKADILGKTVIDLLMSRIKGEEVNSFYVEPALVLRGTTRL